MRKAGSPPLWRPRFTLSPPLVRSLLAVESARAVVEHTPVPPQAADELRRRARLRSTHLHRGGYGLHGFFSLEEHHARDLAAYYESLATHPHHNYYEGRAETDLTPWLEYFLHTLAGVFTAASEEAQAAVPGLGKGMRT